MNLPVPRRAQFGVRFLAFAAALGWPAFALARGGGGEHYDPGFSNDDFGSGSGDGAGAAIVIRLLTYLLFRHPEIGCPLLIIVAVVFFLSRRKAGNAPRTAVPMGLGRRPSQGVSQAQREQWTTTLRAKDAAFDPKQLTEKATRLFLFLQQQWFQRDLSKLRPYVSDATFQRWHVQLELMRRQGVRDAIAEWQLLGVELVGHDGNARFDSVHLRLDARMRDTDVPVDASDAQATAAAMRVPHVPFTEVWTFVRKPGTPTKIGEDLYQGKCPNCGAPYKEGATLRCEHCQAIVNSGQYDWTLTEITQGVEHGPRTVVAGLSELRAKDPAFSLEAAEDRASFLFWRWIDAHSRGDASLVSQVSTEGFRDTLQQELAALETQGQRRHILDCAVGGVTVRRIRSADSGGRTELEVEVLWSARMAIGPKDARTIQATSSHQHSVFVLVRSAEARSQEEHGVSTARCSNCHAPLTESADLKCSYCGENTVADAKDWLIDRTFPHER